MTTPETAAPDQPDPGPATPGQASPKPDSQGFGTFAGVYRPVVLTILGAMLYLREGWLVGNNGLLGALAVIGAAYVITGTTSLSLSSIATNVRVTAGGPFAIVSRALGLEAGGAIGVPLFVAQAISSVMYLYAFSEGWAYVFPDHDGRLVALAGFVAVGTLAVVSAELVSRTQALMMVVVAAAMVSALAGTFTVELHRPRMIGRFPDAGLLRSFAIFFPAATGIMVGAGMSGELADARRSLPRGTLAAWGSTLFLYTLFAVWYSVIAGPKVLLSHKTVMIDTALVGQVVLLGLLCSTLMAALSSLVAAPRLLQAMATHDIVPFSRWLARTTENGQPRNATLATLGLASVGLASGSLDAIAPVITSCFILTYLALNAVVYLEQRLAMISFRPTFSIPPTVPLVGMISCVLGMGLASPGGGLLEVLAVVLLYLWLLYRNLDTPWETVHSGLAMTLAAQLALWAARLTKSSRSWKPDLLVPVDSAEALHAVAPLAHDIIRFQGSVKYTATRSDPALHAALDAEIGRLRADGRFSSWHAMPADDEVQGIRLTINAMKGTFFGSNLLLLTDRMAEADLQALRDHAGQAGIGMALLIGAREALPSVARPRARVVNVWLSDRAPDWELGLQMLNADLPVLLAYLIARGGGRIRLYCAVRDPDQQGNAQRFLESLIDQGRLPGDTTAHVTALPFLEALPRASEADLHVLGLGPHIALDRFREIRDAAGGPCVFLRDSGLESLLA